MATTGFTRVLGIPSSYDLLFLFLSLLIAAQYLPAFLCTTRKRRIWHAPNVNRSPQHWIRALILRGGNDDCVNSVVDPMDTPSTSTPKPTKPIINTRQKTSSTPLWSGGVYQEDIEALVDACLKDPDINIKAVPDWLERQIYKSIITLVLNVVHHGLNGIHRKTLWKHELHLTRLPRRKDRLDKALAALSQHTRTPEHTEILEQVADRLLADRYINQPMIPDCLERQIYANCLKIVFRVLDLLAVTFKLTLCGHDLKIKLDPSDDWTKETYQKAALQRITDKTKSSSASTSASSSSSCLNDATMEQMKQLAREMGAAHKDDRPFWQRWLSPTNNEFIAQLHASVYCLVLGILDDFLENTEIQLLSDRIEFELRSMNDVNDDGVSHVGGGGQGVTRGLALWNHNYFDRDVGAYNKANSLVLLTAGIVVGYAVHVILVNKELHLESLLSGARSAVVNTSKILCNVFGRVFRPLQKLPGNASRAANGIVGRFRSIFNKETKGNGND